MTYALRIQLAGKCMLHARLPEGSIAASGFASFLVGRQPPTDSKPDAAATDSWYRATWLKLRRSETKTRLIRALDALLKRCRRLSRNSSSAASEMRATWYLSTIFGR